MISKLDGDGGSYLFSSLPEGLDSAANSRWLTQSAKALSCLFPSSPDLGRDLHCVHVWQ